MAAALLMLGTIVDGTTAKAELERIIAESKPTYLASYREFVKYGIEKPASQKALLLPADTVIKGDLLLDFSEELEEKNVVAIVALGNLKVEGAIVNSNLEFGPMLFVAGNLEAKRIDKGGSFVATLGDVRLSGPALCEYNHGGLLIGGDLTTELLLNLDHDVTVSGKTIGVSLTLGTDDLREALRPELFPDDDPENGCPDTKLLREHIAAGRPLLRQIAKP